MQENSIEGRMIEPEDNISENVMKVLKTMKPGEKDIVTINIDAFIMNEKVDLPKFDDKSGKDLTLHVSKKGI